MKKYMPFFLGLLFFGSSCNENIIDDQKPEIDISFESAFPLNCDTLYFGDTLSVKIKFTDNVELGTFSIEIHDNFDHHSHTTEINNCSLSPKKEPVNPFYFLQDFTIPDDNPREFISDLQILVPSKNQQGNFDEGDYHFFISLTDKEGWSTKKGLSIKMLHRQQ